MSTIPLMADVEYALVLKTVALEPRSTPTPDFVPAERITYNRLASARFMAARILVNARERGWKAFNVGGLDPYHWAILTDGSVHFLTIEAVEPTP